MPSEYRRLQNYVVNSVTRQIIYTPPPPYDVAPPMAELVAWLNTVSDVHPVLVSRRRAVPIGAYSSIRGR